MIELSVSLASNGVVKVPGYEQMVRFGYTKNRGVYRLAVTAAGEWEGLIIRAFWHLPGGADPPASLVVDGYVAVPASVTVQPGNGCITFEGSDGTKTVTSADLRYRVSANSGTEDGTEPEPDSPAWQQLVDAVHTDATAAEQAKTDAQTAAKQAGASVKKAGQALSDTITAKEDALKAIGDKQTTATQAVDTARDKALQQVEASTKAAQTAASEAATSAGNADQSAQKAADSLRELKDGIANGNFKGEPGNDGKSPVVTVTDIENGHRVSITDKDGTKTIDVLNGQAGKDGTQIDDATVGPDAWSSKHIVDMLCPPLEETGNPLQCYPVANYPLGVTASWEPTQEGSAEPSPDNVRPIKGRDSVTVTRCGETLWSLDKITLQTYNSNITTKIDMDAVNLLPRNVQLYFSGECSTGTLREVRFYDGTGAEIGTLRANGGSSTVLKAGNIATVRLYAGLDENRERTCTNLQITLGTTAPTAYAPYTGQTSTLTLPRTIYGGTVDAVTGVGKEVWRSITLDGVSEKFVNEYDDYWNLLPMNTPGISNQNIDYIVSSHFYHAFGGNITGFLFTTSSMMKRYFATPDELNAYIAAQYAAGTPVQIAYKLVTPEPFTATGALPIPALPGVNTIMTDADSVTVTGRADPIKRITDLEDAVASMTNT